MLVVGEIGYDRKEFLYELKLWEIDAIVEGYRRRYAMTWEPARWQSYVWLMARGAKHIDTPQQLVKFAWEDEIAGSDITDDEVDELRAELRAMNKKGGQD